jgi:hypothetical protein
MQNRSGWPWAAIAAATTSPSSAPSQLHPMVQLVDHQALHLLGPDALGDIAHHAGEEALPVRSPLGHRQLQRKGRAVVPQALDLAADADDAALAGGLVARQVAIVRGVVGLGHQHLDVAPDDLAGEVAEQALSSRIKGADGARLVDHHDGVYGRIDDGAVARLGAHQPV